MAHATTTRHLSAEMRKCIDTCDDCRAACLTTATYCLEQGGEHAQPDHIRLLLDCAEICATSAGFMLRGSNLHGDVCGVCADVCERCAESCESIGDDEQMRACARACRQCAETCRQMAGGAA
jgi:hypothetical protein